MKAAKVLEVRAVEMVKAVGFFKFEDGPINQRWALNLPSSRCGFYNDFPEVIEKVLKQVVRHSQEFDYVTVFDDDFSNPAKLELTAFFEEFPFHSDARVNIPAKMLFGGWV